MELDISSFDKIPYSINECFSFTASNPINKTGMLFYGITVLSLLENAGADGEDIEPGETFAMASYAKQEGTLMFHPRIDSLVEDCPIMLVGSRFLSCKK